MKSPTVNLDNISRDDLVLILSEVLDNMGALSNPSDLAEQMDVDYDDARSIVDAVRREQKAINSQTPDLMPDMGVQFIRNAK